MSRTGRRFATVALVLAGAAGAVFGPRVLREVDLFTVRSVEVTGTRYMEPYSVVRAAGIDTASNLFDDADAWREGILALPLAVDVEVRRRLPGTLILDVVESEPVALATAGVLRPVDASGRVLPIEPAGAALDLPVVAGVKVEGDTLSGLEGREALRALLTLRLEAPDLADRISQIEVGPDPGRTLRVLFRDDRAEALLPLDASRLHMKQLRLAYADLVARGELNRVRRIDLRFRDQVVVSFLSSPVI